MVERKLEKFITPFMERDVHVTDTVKAGFVSKATHAENHLGSFSVVGNPLNELTSCCFKFVSLVFEKKI